jgi:hypothetical protein
MNMNNAKTPVITAIIVAVALAAAAVMFRQPTLVSAQTESQSGGFERISFGSVGITSGQTLRVSVANTFAPNDPNLPPGPSRVVIAFRLMNGNLVRTRSGEAVRRVVDLERGDSALLDLDYDQLPPGPTRFQIRPVITVLPPPVGDTVGTPPDGTASSVEVINNANGRTQFSVFTHPASLRGFNPQPDPPAEP